MAPTLAALAMHWELLDPRETDYLTSEQDFLVDLKALQSRFAEASTTPPERRRGGSRFPPLDLADQNNLEFNRAYHKSVKNRLDLDMIHGDELRDILTETRPTASRVRNRARRA